jgi:hypothetical protein
MDVGPQRLALRVARRSVERTEAENASTRIHLARSDRSMVRTMRKRAFPAIIFA